jgi:chromosome segregation ATPase
MQDSTDETSAMITQLQSKLASEVAAKEKEEASSAERLAANEGLHAQIAALKAAQEVMMAALEESKVVSTALGGELEDREGVVKELESALAGRVAEVEAGDIKAENLNGTIAEKDVEILKLRDKVIECEIAVEAMREQVDLFNSSKTLPLDAKVEINKVSELRKKLNQQTQDFIDLEGKSNRTHAKLRDAEFKNMRLQSEINSLTGTSEVKTDLNALRASVMELRKRK